MTGLLSLDVTGSKSNVNNTAVFDMCVMHVGCYISTVGWIEKASQLLGYKHFKRLHIRLQLVSREEDYRSVLCMYQHEVFIRYFALYMFPM